MVLSIFFVSLALLAQGLTYYFAGWYQSPVWIWTWIVVTYLYYWGIFGTYLIFIYLYASVIRSKEEKGVKEWKPNRFAMWIIAQTAFQIFLLFRVRVHASGMGKIPEKTRFVIVHNHLSMFDEFALAYLFRHQPLVFVTKPDNLRIPIAGAWMKKAGYIPIIQNDLNDGKRVMERCTGLLEEKKTCICIAPEGTRNKDFPDPITLPFHPGSFSMAVNSSSPIVILAIQNTNAISSRIPIKKTHVYIDVVSVMMKQDYENLTLSDIAKRAQERINARLEQKKARAYHLKKKDNEGDNA